MSVPTGSKANPAGAWLRGVLELATMATLTEGERHGYALMQRLSESGLGPIRGGVLYPVLGRLEVEGAVSSTWQAGDGGPGRKVYQLTKAGRERLVAERALWRDFSRVLSQLLERTEEEQ
ncbi:PadR family transcriptional regulator [Streptomyces sp. NPDC019396]|uniref:PadR family transcriptional regulator n=1 Tax=Streptomyces sp. NPDC019396 TaxID=3154687 RepID=UPI0033CFFD5E